MNYNAERTFNSHRILMSDSDCQKISEIVTNFCGIKLGQSKKIMIQSRMDRRLVCLNLTSYDEYLTLLKNDKNELENLINALTTNKTEFLREKDHFDKLVNIIDQQYSKRTSANPLYIWSAACSTGEEVYTLATLLEEYKFKRSTFSYKILGSDIDTTILNQAQNGVYPKSRLAAIPPNQIHRYFNIGTQANNGLFKVKNSVQQNIKFRYHNLIKKEDTFPIKFDVIFLRNVLIYFDLDNIQIVIDKLNYHLNPGGYLFIGHSESLNGIDHCFKTISGSMYRKI